LAVIERYKASAGTVYRLGDDGALTSWFVPYCVPSREEEAERIAAALNAQAVERNRAELLAEDVEAFHLALDKHGVPRADEAGAVFSMYGRALRLNAQAGVVGALRAITDDYAERFDVDDPATNPGIRHAIAQARAALAAVKGVDRG
jgi:hypothetical protein